MIRIDEIYNNTFWPWIKSNVPQTRMFFCDPPGDTSPSSLFNYGNDYTELYYILFHDQEPVHLDIHQGLFDDAVRRNRDLGFTHTHWPGETRDNRTQAFVHSEYNSEAVAEVCDRYNWQPYYYFFHGWAALDWYRGYDKTYLKPTSKIKHTFLFPNNIIGGRRRHRLELFVELERRGLIENNLVSIPDVCPYENQTAQQLCDLYGLDYHIQTPLPLRIDDFYENYANSSHELNMWDSASQCLLQVVGETLYTGKRNHLTEKTFKPIAMGQPFVLASCQGSLEYLRSYGFRTFDSVWDESYDQLPDEQRTVAIADLLKELENSDLEHLHHQCVPIVEHNLNHFYNGGFERVLWKELKSMLGEIRRDFGI